MTRWAAGVAIVAWLIGASVLGFDWHGRQRSPGVWVDGVSLAQWAVCWCLLALLGAGTARWLPRWPMRVLALLPLSAWIVWQLRDSTLGPIPMVIYLVPTVLAWTIGLLAGPVIRQRWHGP